VFPVGHIGLYQDRDLKYDSLASPSIARICRVVHRNPFSDAQRLFRSSSCLDTLFFPSFCQLEDEGHKNFSLVFIHPG
jgi:hypothetical protein